MAGGSRNHTQSPSKRRVQPKHRKRPNPLPDPASLVPPASDHPVRSPSATAPVERCIAAILQRRFHIDVARLYSTRLARVCQNSLPALMLDIVLLTGPGWMAANASSEGMRTFLRGPIAMDLRQAEERVATKSLLWSYTAIRHFAISHGVEICGRTGVYSEGLLPHLPQLEAYLRTLDRMPNPKFTKPQTIGPLYPKMDLLERQCLNCVKKLLRSQNPKTPGKQYDSYIESITNKKSAESDETKLPPAWRDWRTKLRAGYDVLVETVWEVANEFDPSGFGSLLRGKLEDRWCDCGCSTDSLADVCEPAIREDEENGGHRTRAGKGREWDGRGAGILGWSTADEEDAWTLRLDFGYEVVRATEKKTAQEMLEQRYVEAEKEKDQGNKAFREARYQDAVRFYSAAHECEPEMAHYQLNLAAAHLKLSNWIAAEEACSKSLRLHRSQKGFWRRCKARQQLGKWSEALEDVKAMLLLAPYNEEAVVELNLLKAKVERDRTGPMQKDKIGPPDASVASGSSSQGQSGSGASSSSRKLPFDLTDIDFTKVTIAPSKRSWDVPGRQHKDTFPYPTWEAYDIQIQC